ncbi:MAG: flavodoxin family protein [Deltaproteobacteria bacterium]|jgi:multimeric flavodoxin WrbA|nr:flavodoxin family protein [Deltaproteobacteria bacterium]
MIIAFSGTPIKGGNIEKGLEAICQAAGDCYELVRLSEIDMAVCRACKGCVETNRCVIEDDVNGLLEKIEGADAILMSGYPSFGSVNALTKVFVERNWPLRHNRLLTKGKVSASVVCGSSAALEVARWFETYMTGYLLTRYQGALVLEGNVPCLSCGYGESCQGSGFLSRNGPGAKIRPESFSDFSQSGQARARAMEIGLAMREALAS